MSGVVLCVVVPSSLFFLGEYSKDEPQSGIELIGIKEIRNRGIVLLLLLLLRESFGKEKEGKKRRTTIFSLSTTTTKTPPPPVITCSTNLACVVVGLFSTRRDAKKRRRRQRRRGQTRTRWIRKCEDFERREIHPKLLGKKGCYICISNCLFVVWKLSVPEYILTFQAG